MSSPVVGQDVVITVESNPESDDYGDVALDVPQDLANEVQSKNLTFKEWSSFFRLSVKGSARAVLGTYSVKENKLIFTPRFLPDPQVSYVVRFIPDQLELLGVSENKRTELIQEISYKELVANQGKVQAIYPEADVLPSNILRFYLVFSSPMGFQNPYDFISIENDQGERLSEPFVEVKEGLWSPDRKRLTVLLHPGRIKRGVGPNMTQGEILEEGKTYRVIISSDWMDQNGKPLSVSHTKEFAVASAVRTKLSIENWLIQPPKAETSEPLIIKTKRILDQALSQRYLVVEDGSGNRLDGHFEFDSKALKLSFTPKDFWNPTEYFIISNPKLEDVSGNTLVNAFDVDGSMKQSQAKIFKASFIPR